MSDGGPDRTLAVLCCGDRQAMRPVFPQHQLKSPIGNTRLRRTCAAHKRIYTACARQPRGAVEEVVCCDPPPTSLAPLSALPGNLDAVLFPTRMHLYRRCIAPPLHTSEQTCR